MARRKKRSKSKKRPDPQRPLGGELQSPVPRPEASPPSAGKATPTSTVQKLLLVTFGLAAAVVLLLVLEGALALFGLGEDARYEDPFVGFEPGVDLFHREARPGGDVYVVSPAKLAFFNRQEFPADKAPGAHRIFALGGSTTAGRPYDAEVAFAHWLELYLAEMDPSRRFEVVNAGAISYASYRIVLLMRELVRYEPDLFVIYTGHNEFLEERTYAGVRDEDRRWRKLRLWLGRWRIAALFREGLKGMKPEEEVPRTLLESEVTAKLETWTGLDAYHRDDELKNAVIRHFGFNLRQMARIARDHGAGVVFIRPVSNLKDFSPFKSEAGAPPEMSADHQFQRGRELFLAGRFAEARRAFVLAKDLDVAPLRALEPVAELVGEVAAETGSALIDLAAILEDDCESRFGHRILGNEYLLDHVHPDIPVHSLIAERVIDVLAGMGVARPDPSWSEARRREVYERLVGSLDREYYAYRDLNLAKVLGWSGKLEEAEAPLERAAEVLTGEPDLHLNLGILYQKTGRPEEAVRELSRAMELDAGSPEAHFNLGVSYGLLGRFDEGIEALEEALRLRPDYGEARYNLGVLLRRRGDLDAALDVLAAALEERPGAPEVHREIGLVYRRQGRLDDAAAELRRALEIDPEDAVARTDLAVTYGRQGRPDEAAAELERAIALEPGYAEAHYNLGVVRSRLGRADEAEAAYRRTLGIDPGHVDALNNLGILLAGRDELGEARVLLERAVELAPEFAEAHLNLGVVYDRSGLKRLAIAAVKRASELEPDNPKIRQAMDLLENG